MKHPSKKNFTLISLFILFPLTGICKPSSSLRLGADRIDEVTCLLEGKRVGLLVNHTSILTDTQVHLLDTLLNKGVDIKKVFAPEHGFRGTADAGEQVNDSKDQKTGVPIVSIYGKNYKPTAEQLQDIDVVVFDIQDVGARFYTYISSMHYMMEACAENNVELIILDRPNPCDYVDGPVRKKGFESFVGVHPIPILHGLTVGELAGMINGERWLKSDPEICRLRVIKMQNWKHCQSYSLPIKPSPNLPNDQSIRLYASLCLFEATNISIGRGTYFPFQVIGYPYKKFGGFTFTPTELEGFDKNPIQKGKTCYGLDLREYPLDEGFSLRFILDFYRRGGSDPAFFFVRPSWFDRLAGTDELRKQISRGMSEEDIRSTWQEELSRYKAIRKKYLLYPSD
jgi:uncharacterized protein YbbC (DUF1343 family)